MAGHLGHRLRPLAQRLNANQRFKRRAKQMKKGTRMEQFEKELGGTQQAVAKAFMLLGDAYKKRNRINLALSLANLAAYILLAGRVLGWW